MTLDTIVSSPFVNLSCVHKKTASHNGEAGGAGLCVSAIAVHGKLAAGGRERLAFCSAASAAKTAPSAAVGKGVGAGGSALAKEDIMVYQYKICPFCNKLKAVMDYLGVPYKVTEVTQFPFDALGYT